MRPALPGGLDALRRVLFACVLAVGLVISWPAFAPCCSPAYADHDVQVRSVQVTWNGHAPRVGFDARRFATARVREKLKSGLPQRIVTRVYAFRRGSGRPISLSLQTCRVVYDLWEEVFRVQTRNETDTRQATYDSLDGAVDACLRFQHLQVGRTEDYAPLQAQPVYFGVLIELNPLSPETLERIRRWLARPGGGGTLEGDAFFGSFVSIFVNRRIGSAEHRLQFRSPPVKVP